MVAVPGAIEKVLFDGFAVTAPFVQPAASRTIGASIIASARALFPGAVSPHERTAPLRSSRIGSSITVCIFGGKWFPALCARAIQLIG
jgi:hypothetical protein